MELGISCFCDQNDSDQTDPCTDWSKSNFCFTIGVSCHIDILAKESIAIEKSGFDQS